MDNPNNPIEQFFKDKKIIVFLIVIVLIVLVFLPKQQVTPVITSDSEPVVIPSVEIPVEIPLDTGSKPIQEKHLDIGKAIACRNMSYGNLKLGELIESKEVYLKGGEGVYSGEGLQNFRIGIKNEFVAVVGKIANARNAFVVYMENGTCAVLEVNPNQTSNYQ